MAETTVQANNQLTRQRGQATRETTMAKEAIVEKTPPAKPEGRAGSLAKQGLISDKAMAKLNAKKKTAKPAEELAPAPKPAAKKVDVEIEGADENGDVTKGVKVPGGKVATTK